jgi:ABC-type multidrug transport system fused ATPase/permease subunit
MGGVPLQQFNVQALRNYISYVQQDVFLFSDTVADNISFGSKDPVGLEVVKNAASLAAVDHEIEGFEKGYDTLIGERGVTLSGGQKQKFSIATTLINKPTIVFLDEPTTGLHVDDIKKLLDVLHKLVDKGNTVLVIEHNMDVIKTADHIIDVGPEGGEKGGRIVVQGVPQTVAACNQSHTGFYLKEYLPQAKSV